jgi:hypothetical protein
MAREKGKKMETGGWVSSGAVCGLQQAYLCPCPARKRLAQRLAGLLRVCGLTKKTSRAEKSQGPKLEKSNLLWNCARAEVTELEERAAAAHGEERQAQEDKDGDDQCLEDDLCSIEGDGGADSVGLESGDCALLPERGEQRE